MTKMQYKSTEKKPKSAPWVLTVGTAINLRVENKDIKSETIPDFEKPVRKIEASP